MNKKKFFVLFGLFSFITGYSQVYEPVKWEFKTNILNDSTAELLFEAIIDDGWYIYSQNVEEGGPIPTTFYFNEIKNASLSDKVIEENATTEYNPFFEIDLKSFSKKTTFRQQIKTNTDSFVVKGELEFMACNDVMCLPPEYIEFTFNKSAQNIKPIQETTTSAINSYIIESIDLDNPILNCGEKREEQSMWGIFLLGILGGFIALLTPCVFPMIPLTVSFFTKGSEDKSKGVIRASLYGFFILLIYFLLSLPFHLMPNLDPEILNQISTNTYLNIGFFLIFMFFAFSFFGFYELTLPNKWANKTDTASNTGGIIGIFFMALTLAIVSFSCTGPILGSLLAGTLSAANADTISLLGLDIQLVSAKLSLGMLGFGLALGLPFALFAAFPSWLQSLPKSGGWLNTVKVILGFLEVALAIKFLSNADLVEQWGLLKRETFFALWFLTFLGMGLYLMGKIKFPHDSPIKRYGTIRISSILLSFAFVIYLFPGIIGQNWWSHKLLSGFPPPKYYSYIKKEHDISVFKDYKKGLAIAKEKNMPIMLDFTGWACVNCRKMEDDVWVEKEVKDILNNKYIVISLYVDEKTPLPEDQQDIIKVPTSDGGTKLKTIKNIGQKWSTLETLTFGNNTQPLYVLLSPDERLLGNPIGYSYGRDVNKFVEYLNCGIQAFKEIQ